MNIVYVFEVKVIMYGGGRYVIYPLKEYQEKLKKFHEEKVKVIVVKESDQLKYLQIFTCDYS